MKTDLYWSCSHGKFVNKRTGGDPSWVVFGTPGPVFSGSRDEWYEILVETLIDCVLSAKTHVASFNTDVDVHVSHEIAQILSKTVLFKSNNTKSDGERRLVGRFNCSTTILNILEDAKTNNVIELKRSDNDETIGTVTVLDMT